VEPLPFNWQLFSEHRPHLTAFLCVNMCLCTVQHVCMHQRHLCMWMCAYVLEVLLWSDRARFRGLVEKSSICIWNVTRSSSRHLLKARGESTQIKGLTLRESPDHPAHRKHPEPCAGTTRSSVHHPHMQHRQRLILLFFPLFIGSGSFYQCLMPHLLFQGCMLLAYIIPVIMCPLKWGWNQNQNVFIGQINSFNKWNDYEMLNSRFKLR